MSGPRRSQGAASHPRVSRDLAQLLDAGSAFVTRVLGAREAGVLGRRGVVGAAPSSPPLVGVRAGGGGQHTVGEGQEEEGEAAPFRRPRAPTPCMASPLQGAAVGHLLPVAARAAKAHAHVVSTLKANGSTPRSWARGGLVRGVPAEGSAGVRAGALEEGEEEEGSAAPPPPPSVLLFGEAALHPAARAPLSRPAPPSKGRKGGWGPPGGLLLLLADGAPLALPAAPRAEAAEAPLPLAYGLETDMSLSQFEGGEDTEGRPAALSES
jgi:hypothetical protein